MRRQRTESVGNSTFRLHFPTLTLTGSGIVHFATSYLLIRATSARCTSPSVRLIFCIPDNLFHNVLPPRHIFPQRSTTPRVGLPDQQVPTVPYHIPLNDPVRCRRQTTMTSLDTAAKLSGKIPPPIAVINLFLMEMHGDRLIEFYEVPTRRGMNARCHNVTATFAGTWCTAFAHTPSAHPAVLLLANVFKLRGLGRMASNKKLSWLGLSPLQVFVVA